ncbi:MAG: hypothetical protein OJF49_003983 [Ktedonobacterales bacterium]|nr:MAG: hypothetical protein OJF49_003983 [Ktedonobacterales bacterium]
MRECPSCGFANPENVVRCQQCGRPLPMAREEAPPPVSTPGAPPPDTSLPPPPAMPTVAPTPPPVLPPPPPPTYPYGAPPARPPIPMQPRAGQRGGRRQYFLGLGLGLIPLLLALIGVGFAAQSNNVAASNAASVLLLVALVGYIAEFIGMIVCLSLARVRSVGYGLLTMVVATPVIAVISCFAVLFSSAPVGG